MGETTDESQEEIERRIVSHERELAKRMGRMFVETSVLYGVIAALIERFGNGGNNPAFALTIEWTVALTVLAVIATLIVATSVTAWLPDLVDPESWHGLARQRSARAANAVLGRIAAVVLPATFFHDIPHSWHLGTALAAGTCFVIVGIAAEAMLAIAPKSNTETRIRVIRIDDEIRELERRLREPGSTIRPAIVTDLLIVTVLTFAAVASSIFVAYAAGAELPPNAIASTGTLLTSSMITTLAAAFLVVFPQSVWSSRRPAESAVPMLATVGAYSVAMIVVFDLLQIVDLPTVARWFVLGVASLTPSVLVILGTVPRHVQQTRTVVPTSLRALLDWCIERDIAKLKKERTRLREQLSDSPDTPDPVA